MIFNHFPRPRDAGFTLIETVIVVALSAIMMAALALLIYNFNVTSLYERTLAESSGSASALMRELESLTLSAHAVLDTHDFSTSSYTSSPAVLVLEIPSIDSSGNALTNTYDYAVVYVVGTQAYRLLEVHALSVRTPGTKLMSSTIESLTFTYNDADFTNVNTVTVDVQTRAQVKQATLSDRRREQIRLRNY